jgi:hypothetical protein
MGETITLTGKVGFEPEDRTKKHKNQASWKKVAMIFFDGDICEYYSWFLYKKYNIVLNKPLRGAHVSFINDSMRDLTQNGEKTEVQALLTWESVKKKWHGKKIDVVLDLNVRTNAEHWWLNIPHEEREVIQGIRNELGLPKPYFGLHMSIGTARHGIHQEHSKYIHELIKLGYIK